MTHGMILVKLMSIVGDMLFYSLDMQSLEVYPNSVTLRKNAATIYRLIGYKMGWYRSATLQANVVNTYSSGATIPRFCTFTTEDGDITYTTVTQEELPSNMTNNGTEILIELVQGIPVTPSRASSTPYVQPGAPWHSIYNYNYSSDDVINNRIYLDDNDIDESHIIVIDDQNEEWYLLNNVYLTREVGRFFEFNVDVNDRAYIELVDYWENFNVKNFKIFYLRSMGSDGEVYANTLTKLTGNVWASGGSETNPTVYNVNQFIHFTHYNSTTGSDPETPDEARKNSTLYQNTLDTLITLADFERAVLREPGVANVRATDLTNDPGTSVEYAIGNITMDKRTNLTEEGETVYSDIIDEEDVTALENYLADSTAYPLSTLQKRLADINQDGKIDSQDLQCLKNYLEGKYEQSGVCGIQNVSDIELLKGFIVKLYILRTQDYEDQDDETYTNMILSDLQDYKILPLTLIVDLHSIQKYYWTIKGSFLTKTPLSRDELQTIMVNINNTLRHKYAPEEINFNTSINFKDVLETILSVDNRILDVDLEPIEYTDVEGNVVSKETLTGNYQLTVPQKQDEDDANNVSYSFTLPNAPILPNSVLIRVNFGQYTLKDNSNGEIANIDNILVKNGTIDYVTGEVNLEFVSPVEDDIIIDYTKNKANVATYKNLSTQSFYFNPLSLLSNNMQDLI